MRLRLSNRVALLAAAGIVMVAAGTPGGAAPPTYASQLHDLTAGNFREVALQGFGDPQNSWAWAMGWYKNRLYVGTNRAWDCTTYAIFAHTFPYLSTVYPPVDPDLAVQCPKDPHALPEAGEIWSAAPGRTSPLRQADWTEVYQSPYAVNMTAKGSFILAARDMAFRGMAVYHDVNGQDALYVSGIGTANLYGAQMPPPSLLRTTDGVTWRPVPARPGTTMGNINKFGWGGCCLRGAVAYNGRFYLVRGYISGDGAVLESPDPRRGDNSFKQITPSDWAVWELQPFNGHLYLGLSSGKGYEVLRTDAACQTFPCPSSAFKVVVPPGGGLSSQGSGVLSMHVFTDANHVSHLYVGTGTGSENALGSAPTQGPAEVIRVNADDSWDLIVGEPRLVNGVMKYPTSMLHAGFDNWFNQHMWRMDDYQGVLYLGTFNVSTGFKDTSWRSVLQPGMGFNLWASRDGLTFSPVTLNGFGDPFSYGARTLQATPYGLFVGSANYWKGLRIWQGAIAPHALQLAPTNLQADYSDSGGGVSLVWDTPGNATIYHVYRSDDQTLPPPKKSDTQLALGAALHLLPLTVPGRFVEIGTTTKPYFVDHGAFAGQRYTYYIVAQDKSGNLSAPSNAVAAPSPVSLPTFLSAGRTVTELASRRTLPAAVIAMVRRGLGQADARLHRGDPQQTYVLLDALRQRLLASAKTPNQRLYAEQLATMLQMLEKRVILVQVHVVDALRLH